MAKASYTVLEDFEIPAESLNEYLISQRAQLIEQTTTRLVFDIGNGQTLHVMAAKQGAIRIRLIRGECAC